MVDPLTELIRISHTIGSDPDLVQGGGGNTSVKTRDGVRMLVKASGTALASMDRSRGWADLELSPLREILEDRKLGRLGEKNRESEVLRRLAATVIEPKGARPSVESNLHALLARVVIHTHPVGLNAFLCARASRRRYRDLLRAVPAEPLYIPYVDPGFVLAKRVEREIARYRRRHGHPPSILLLENHGLFVAAEEVAECLALSRRITDLGKRFTGGRRINPLVPARWLEDLSKPSPAVCSDGPASGEYPSRNLFELLHEAIRRSGGGGEPVEIAPACLAQHWVIGADPTPIAREFLRDRRALQQAARGAFTPDQIVYCRTHPVILDPIERSASQRVRKGWIARAASRLRAYRARYRLDPRVAIVPGRAILYSTPDAGQLRIVAEVYRCAMTSILRSSRAGGPRFLTRRQAAFIESWEVEAFRARLAAGGGRTGRTTGSR